MIRSMNSSIHNLITTRFVPRELKPICLCWVLILILIVPALSAFGQIKDDDFTACAQQMTKHFGQRGWIGFTPENDEDGAILVEHVFADSPAEKAGIRKGDFVRGVNGQDRETAPARFLEEYDSVRPNRVTIFDLEREGRRLSVSVLVELIPDSVLEHWIQEECQGGGQAD
jgi:S1-C subfamily serine protease